MSSYNAPLRDRIVMHVCNWLLRHVATEQYAAFVYATSTRGVKALDREFGIERIEKQ